MMDDNSMTGQVALDELCHGGWCHTNGPKVAIGVTIHDFMAKN